MLMALLLDELDSLTETRSIPGDLVESDKEDSVSTEDADSFVAIVPSVEVLVCSAEFCSVCVWGY